MGGAGGCSWSLQGSPASISWEPSPLPRPFPKRLGLGAALHLLGPPLSQSSHRTPVKFLPLGSGRSSWPDGRLQQMPGQLAHTLTHPPRPPVLLTDKEKGQLPPDEVLDEAVPEYRAPGRKSLLEIQQLDPDDESLVNYKRALLGPEPPAVGMPMPWAGVGRVG